MLHHIVIAVYQDFELLDATGPASVFASANHALSEDGMPAYYAVHLASPNGGAVQSSSGVVVETKVLTQGPRAVDTILVAGAEAGAVTAAAQTPALRRWLSQSASSVRCIGSVCAGTFVLAAAGLVNGKRVATHWSACELLARLYPSLTVDADALYVIDGNVWTSAGVTTGIDMALAMISEDLGSAIASRVAKRLVLYARRPGYQSQFSPLLRAQAKADGPFDDLLVWAQANLDAALDVPRLAAKVGLSERTFHRRFVAAIGETPAQYIETVRLDAARILLAQKLPLKEIARRVGLVPVARFTRVFQRRFGVTPRLFRETHTSK